ncbi:DUF2922 family protein [Enterococcus sp. DIV0756]|uniref:DUF2922 family protein n=1 Tax=Enterococcus sp. DIV0756 TaxID=2774636 RepID=UPI003F1FC8BD
MTSTTTLAVEFGRSDGKAHRLRFKDFDATKKPDEIQASLTKLTKLSIYDKNDVRLFDEVRRAKLIEMLETEIFDDKKDAKNDTDEAPVAMPMVVEPVQAEDIPQVQEPVHDKETIRIPEDLTITNEYPSPGWLIQTIELPMGVKPQDIGESEAFLLISSCLPPRVLVEDLAVDETTDPVKLIITGKFQEEEPKVEQPAAANKESPPVTPSKKRNRLRKQE